MEAYKTQPQPEATDKVETIHDKIVDVVLTKEVEIVNKEKDSIQEQQVSIPVNSEVITTSQEELKGGLKMSEEIKVEQKIEKVVESETSKQMTAMLESMKAMQEELKTLKASKEVPAMKAEVKEVEEKLPYQIVQGFGSIKGHSFTLVR